jgi:hypothetical protein
MSVDLVKAHAHMARQKKKRAAGAPYYGSFRDFKCCD